MTRTLLVVMVLAFLPAEAAAKWTRLRSANFVFIGDANEGRIRSVARRLERFREAMTRALPGAAATSPVPTVVVVFATERSFAPYMPLFNGRRIEVGGYFQGGEDLNYITINGEHIDLALQAIFHEYSHFLVRNTTGRLPLWVNEGLAEFYEVLQELDGGKSVVLGRAPQHHIELLKGSTLIPIRQLMAIDESSPVYNEGSRRGVFYAESWALTHYLTSSKERAPQFRQYLANLRNGNAEEQAFRESFGVEASVLDRELFDYVRQYTFPALRLDFPERATEVVTERGETLSDIDAEIYLGDLQSRIGRTEEASTRLQNVLKKKRDAARAAAALGLMELRANRLDEALAWLEKAAAEGPDDSVVQSAHGRALIERLSQQRNDSEAAAKTAQQARAALSRAVALDANSSYAAAMLGFIELVSDGDVQRAVLLLERAAQLAPSRDQYRLYLAQALLRQRQFDRAISLLGPLLARGTTLALRNEARELLGVAAQQRAEAKNAANAGISAPAPSSPSSIPPVSNPRPDPVATPPREGQPRPLSPAIFRPDLRTVLEGETRVLGLFRAIECRADLTVLVVDVDGKPLRLGAKQLSDVDFISYRSDAPGRVTCGGLSQPPRVLATYRAHQTNGTRGVVDGDAVAIELLPDGFTPR